MNRLVLALLALLAGLVTQTTPAHARFSGASSAEVAAQVPGSRAVAVQVSRTGCKPQIARVWRSDRSPCAPPQQAFIPASVHIGSDRSRQ